MAQTNYTPIQLYYSSTASAVPVNTNLASGELAINITDGILFYKDNAGTVQKIGYKLTPTTAGGTGLTSFTVNGIVYASSTSALATNSALTFDGSTFAVTGATTVTSSGNSTVTTGIFANTSTGTSAINRFRLNGGTSSAFFEMQGSGFSGTNITNGPTTSALVVWTGSNIPVSIGVNASEIGRFSSTGLAVTGTLSVSASVASATLASSGAYSALSFTNSGGAAASGTILANSSGILQSRAATHAYTNADASSEYMRLTSTGLGIGTSSPAARLSVIAASANSTAATIGGIEYAGSKRGLTIKTFNSAGGDDCGVEFNAANGLAGYGAFKFAANTTTLATIDASGNLGLGVTPSAWFSGYKALETGSGSLVYPGSATNTQLWNNLYVNAAGNVTYKSTGIGGLYSIGGGGNAHTWYYAASGTAGTTATLTQAMTLDASGKLLLGVTSGTGLSNGDFAMGNGNHIRFRNAANSAYISAFEFTSANGLNIGTGGSLSTITFGISGIGEAGRFNTSGNLLVGTTNSDPTFNRVNGAVITSGGAIYSRSTSWDIGLSSTSGTHITFYTDNGSARVTAGFISSNGATTLYNATSDYRLKENIQPMIGALAKVIQLKPVIYDWKDEFAGTNKHGEGFIAHELAEVCPHAVTGEKDAVDENGNPKYQGIDTSFLVATLAAAIQELKAEFDAYKASHP